MANNITFADKVALNENPSVADINKAKATDMNEIKKVVNETILNMLFGVGTNTWNASNTYSKDEVVIYDYLLYFNLTGNNTTTPPDEDTTNWERFSILEDE